jgi:hypothetical protein
MAWALRKPVPRDRRCCRDPAPMLFATALPVRVRGATSAVCGHTSRLP